MTKRRVPMIALLLSFVMMATALLTVMQSSVRANAKDDEVIRYVSIGDSMSSGYGVDLDVPMENNGYLFETETAYPTLVRNHLQAKYPDKKVEFTQLAVNGIRTNELRYALEYGQKGAYPGDQMRDYYLEFTEEVVMTYQKAVREADYISIGLGNNDFLQTFISQTLGAVSNIGKNEESVYRPKFNPYLEYMIYEDNEFRKVLAETTYTQIRALVIATMNLLGGRTFTKTYIPVMEEVIGYFVYAFVGFIKNYEAIMDQIVKMNNNVHIMLVGMVNVLRGEYLSFDLGKLKVKIDIGDIMAIMSEGFNNYVKDLAKKYNLKSSLSPKSHYSVYFVEAKDVTIIGKGFGNGVDDKRRPQLIRETISNFIDSIERVGEDMFAALDEMGLGSFISDITLDDASKYYSRYTDFIMGLWAPQTREETNEMLTMATYMAFEEALVDVTQTDTIDGSGLLAVIGGSESIFDVKGADALLENSEIIDIFSIENIQRAIEEKDFETYITRPLYEIIIADSRLMGYLFITGAMYFDGTRGVHPDENGHEQYAKAVCQAIDAKGPLRYQVKNFVNSAVSTVTGVIDKTVNGVKITVSNIFNTIASVFNWIFRTKIY